MDCAAVQAVCTDSANIIGLLFDAQVLEQQLGGFRTDEGAVLKKLKEVRHN